MVEFLLYLLTGACTGLLSGLLGIGGGLVIVPMLLLLLAPHHVPAQHLMHVALGTSLATIIFTAISSARAHHLRGGINWPIACRITSGVVLGTLGGAWLAAQLHTEWLKLFFVIFVFYAGTQLLLGFNPPPSRRLPGKAIMFGAGNVIGIVSSLVGIGGGTLSVPFLLYYQCPMREAVGTSAFIGLPLAIAGAVGYAIMGWGVAGLPPYSLGFVYLPAVAGITLASIVTAPYGAKLAHHLPVATLKKLFALLLYTLGLKMLWGLL